MEDKEGLISWPFNKLVRFTELLRKGWEEQGEKRGVNMVLSNIHAVIEY